ncbi:hypothetical protein Tco_0325338 [Tanacetum coccineum]
MSRLNNLNFFDLYYSIDHSDVPNDDKRNDTSPNRYGPHSPHSGSTSKPQNENEGGNSQGSDAAASEDDGSVNHEDNINIVSEGNGTLFSSQNDQDTSET